MNSIFKKALLFFGIIIIISSCGPTATFDAPQPFQVKSENAIDKAYRGTYVSSDYLRILSVTDDLITAIDNNTCIETLVDSLPSSVTQKGDTLLHQRTNCWEMIERTDSSVLQKTQRIDTIFQIGKDQILKKHKGHYFLNWQDQETKKWYVNKLSLQQNLLTLAAINNENDLEALNQINPTHQRDTINRTINYSITNKQFNQFLKQDGFSDIDTFIRLQ